MASRRFLTVRNIVTLSQQACFCRYIPCQVRCPRDRKNSTGYFGLIIFNIRYVDFSETLGNAVCMLFWEAWQCITIVAANNKKVLNIPTEGLCLCSCLSRPACKAHVPDDFVICGLLSLPNFSTQSLINDTIFKNVVEPLCASSPLCDIQLVWQYMCLALTVKHNYFIG